MFAALSSVLPAQIMDDSASALGVATILQAFCQFDAEPALLGRPDIVALILRVLQVISNVLHACLCVRAVSMLIPLFACTAWCVVGRGLPGQQRERGASDAAPG